MILGVGILFLILSYFFYKNSMCKIINKKRLILSVALALFIVILLPKKVWKQYDYCPKEIVKITVKGEKREIAQGNEIVINNLIIDGKYYDILQYIVSGNWYTEKNVANWRTYDLNMPLTDIIEIELPAGRERSISFSSNVYRGMAEISYRGKNTIVDFFADTTDLSNELKVEFNGKSNYPNGILIIYKLFIIISISCIIYCLFLIGGEWLKRKNSNYDENDLWINVLLFLFVFWGLSLHSNSPYSYTIPWVDSDVFLYGGWAMKNGEKMYMDFWDHKGPYLYFIEYLGFAITDSWIGVWVIELISVTISIISNYYLIRKFANKFISIIALYLGYSYLIFYLGYGNYIESYTLPLISISALLYKKYFYNNKYDLSSGTCIKLGFLFMVAFLLRQNSIAIWIIFCLGIILYTIFLKKYKKIVQYGIGFITGMLIALVPVIIYITYNGIWKEFYKAYFEFNFKYVENGGDKIATLKYFTLNYINLFFLIGLFILLLNQEFRKKYMVESLCLTGWYLLSLVFTCMAGYTWAHYAIILLPIYPIGIAILLLYLDNKLLQIERKKANYIIAILAFMLTFIIMIDDKTNMAMYHDSMWIIQYSPNNSSEEKIICNKIRSMIPEDSKISVYGNACSYYLLSERKSVSKYTYQNPICIINNEIGMEYIKDILDNLPAAIVIPDKKIFLNENMTNTNEKLLEILNEYYYLDYDGEHGQLYYNKFYGIIENEE